MSTMTTTTTKPNVRYVFPVQFRHEDRPTFEALTYGSSTVKLDGQDARFVYGVVETPLLGQAERYQSGLIGVGRIERIVREDQVPTGTGEIVRS
jgi:hypothetical protein